MTTALAVIDSNELETIQRTGKLLAASGYFDAKGDAITQMAQMAAKIMAGRELGFGPFASVNGIYIIKGRPSVSASLMATAVKNSQRYDYRVKKLDDDGCTLEFFEMVNGKRESIGISTFTRADATKAGTENMGKFPRNMMFARAMSNGVKWFCPDVFSGNAIYVPEELGAETDGEGNVIEVQGRTVDTSTGEILDDVDLGMAQAQSAPASNGKAKENPLLNTFHALGMAFYGDKEKWNEKRRELVMHISRNKFMSSKDLPEAMLSKLIERLEDNCFDMVTELANEAGISGDEYTALSNKHRGNAPELVGVGLAHLIDELRKMAEKPAAQPVPLPA